MMLSPRQLMLMVIPAVVKVAANRTATHMKDAKGKNDSCDCSKKNKASNIGPK